MNSWQPWVRWVVGIGAGLLILLMIHPLLLGLPGRIGEFRFERGLHEGMSRGDVAALAHSTGGQSGSGEWLWGESNGAREEIDSGALPIMYADLETICVGSGNLYLLHFDRADRLSSWRAEYWSQGC